MRKHLGDRDSIGSEGNIDGDGTTDCGRDSRKQELWLTVVLTERKVVLM